MGCVSSASIGMSHVTTSCIASICATAYRSNLSIVDAIWRGFIGAAGFICAAGLIDVEVTANDVDDVANSASGVHPASTYGDLSDTDALQLVLYVQLVLYAQLV